MAKANRRTPTRRTLLPVSITIIVLIASSVLATPVRGDYTISISQGTATVAITGDMLQGLPMPSPINTSSYFAQTPILHTILQGANASILENALSNAIRAKSPSSSISGVVFSANSNGTRLHYALSFSIANLSSDSNGKRNLDLSWRSFVITDDFGANGVSINRVIPNYLQTTIVTDAQGTSSTPGIQEVRTWYLNDLPVPAAQIASRTGNLMLIDFSSLSTPLGQWSTQRDLANSQVMLQAQTGFNLTFVVRITEAETTGYFANNAVNKLSVKITAPLPAQISDNSLIFDEGQSSWVPQLMLLSVGTIIVLLVATMIVERRIQPHGGSSSRKIRK